MSWASRYIDVLKSGNVVKFRPSGNSMSPLVESRQLVTVRPVAHNEELSKGDIVLCRVNGKEYLHKVLATDKDRVQIGNNKGGINGWTNRSAIYGICIGIED